jgi:hypothetical protein
MYVKYNPPTPLYTKHYSSTTIIQGRMARAAMLLTCIWEVPGSNLERDINSSDVLVVFHNPPREIALAGIFHIRYNSVVTVVQPFNIMYNLSYIFGT